MIRVVLAALLLSALTVPGGAALAAAKPNPVLRTAKDLVWTDNPAIPGARSAVLWGDPKTGAFGALRSLTAGTEIPLHSHRFEQKVVIVAGTVAVTVAGLDTQDLGPGSYAFIPRGVPHRARCREGADCLYLEEEPGAFDFKLVDPKPASDPKPK